MKIQSYKIDSFINGIANNKDIKAVLLYGPDEGLNAVRFKKITDLILGNGDKTFNLVDISMEQIKENPAILGDEFVSFSMLGGKRVIRIRQAKNAVTKILEEILTNSSDNVILISAGDLDTASSLRKLADKHKNIASLPCYADDDRAILNVISGRLRELGLTFSPQVVNYLGSRFGGNRLIVLSELEKLATYLGDRKELTIEDVELCTTDVSDVEYNHLTESLTGFNAGEVNKLLDKLYSVGQNPVTIARILTTYFTKLQNAKSLMEESGASASQIIEQHYPRMFFKEKPIFTRNLNNWSLKNINDFVKKLVELEFEFKTKNLSPKTELSRVLILACVKYRKRK